MSSNLFVDTSGWVCFLDRDNPLHQETVLLYQRTVSQKRRVVTTNYVMTELVALLSSRLRLTRTRVIQDIDTLRASPYLDIVHITHELDEQAWAFLKTRSDKQWSWVDAASFVVMQTLGLTAALTTDHHFAQAGFLQLPQPNA